MGHRNIKMTVQYSRNKINEQVHSNIMNKTVLQENIKS